MSSFDALSKRLTEKFGAAVAEQDVPPMRQSIHELAKHQKQKMMILNGDVAILGAEGKLYDWGLELHRLDGKWKVTHLTANHQLAGYVLELIQGMAAGAKTVEGALQGGQVTSRKEAIALLNTALSKVMLLRVKYSARTSPPEGVKWDGIDPAAVREYWGKNLFSPEIKKLIASLPGTPYLSLSPQSARLIDQDGGIAVLFLPDSGVQTIFLFADGSQSYLRYPGKLPHGLLISDTRKEVEKKLGRPLTSGGGGHGLAYHADYPEAGISVFYAKDGLRDPDNPIAEITMTPPDRDTQAAEEKPAKGPRVTFRLVVSDPALPADELPYPANAKQKATLRVSREVLLDETSIAGIYPVPERGDKVRLATGMEMTEEGAKKLQKITSENIGHQLAILVDGRIIIAPNIQAAIGKSLVISLGTGAQEKEGADIRGRLHAAVFTLPAEAK
jgi:hypothetical protein